MNILITAGNTLVPLDKVRAITNIFTGRTGTTLALHGHSLGHRVTLLTSHPDLVELIKSPGQDLTQNWQVVPYSAFDDLLHLLEKHIVQETPDVIIHSAAVSDYRCDGIFVSEEKSPSGSTEQEGEILLPRLKDVSAGKVKSHHEELWLRLTKTPKLVDKFRKDWNFSGILVKFKLEVGLGEKELLDVAETSRLQSRADLMVANTLEEAQEWAYIGPVEGNYQKTPRSELPERLYSRINACLEEKNNG